MFKSKIDPASEGRAISTEQGVFALDPMDIPGVDPLDPRGLVPASRMLAALEVNVPMWNPPPEALDTPHILSLYWLRGSIETRVDIRTVNAPPPPLPGFHSLHVPLNILREQSGTVELYYSVVDSFGGRTDLDPKRTITIDMDRPQLLRPDDHLEFVVAPAPLVDEQYLIDYPLVAFRIPAYTGRADKDRIEFYLSNLPNPPAAGPDGTYELEFSADPLIALLPADAFRHLANGDAYVFFRVFDEAGNFSDQSAALPFQLNLIPSPINLPNPQITPPSYDDFLIKRDDARAGVLVRITAYTGWAPGDQVDVYWAGRRGPRQSVISFPCDVEIPWTVLRGPITVPLVPGQVPIRYEIIRVGQPPFPSFSTLINVNLTIAGQDHANAPALLNPTLALVEIRGRNSNTPGFITEADRGENATARVFLYDNPLPGQVLRLFWNGVGPVASYTVQGGDIAGQLVFFTEIPWALIDGTVNPSLPVYYTTSNGVNDQHSDISRVNVSVGPLAQYPMPQVSHTLFNSYLRCCSKPPIFYGVNWYVAAHDDFVLNDEIRFFWQGYRTNNWEEPIGGTDFGASAFLTQEQVSNGVTFVVLPYETKVLPMHSYGSAMAWFQLLRAGGVIGESLPRRIRVDLIFPGSGRQCGPGDEFFCTDEGDPTLTTPE